MALLPDRHRQGGEAAADAEQKEAETPHERAAKGLRRGAAGVGGHQAKHGGYPRAFDTRTHLQIAEKAV